jgi:uncharacterized membrane protein
LSSSPERQPRRAYIDWARGLAVLLMIEAHTLDSWTRAADRRSIAFMDATILGGFAAPLFLWLAGLASVLSAERSAGKLGSRDAALDAVCRRGLEIFILGFLFRLQAFIVSPGSHPIALFRVDILNIMGPAIVAAGLVWWSATDERAQAALFAALAGAIALATPIVRELAIVGSLPTWVQWYIRPAGEYTTFTSFPWIGFVFAGAASGALIASARDLSTERRLQTGLGLSGIALVAAGFYMSTLPSIYARSSFWTSSPTWFTIRVGILQIALSAMFAIERGVSRVPSAMGIGRAVLRTVALSWERPLATFGRHSLLVYWIHVELVYGYASWLWRGRLPLWATTAGWLAFSLLMYGLVIVSVGLRDRRRIGAGSRRWRPAARHA